MKILIVSHGRCGSSILEQSIAKEYNLTLYSELFGTTNKDQTIRSFDERIKLLNNDNYITRIQGWDLLNYDILKIDLSIFDKVYILQRKNLTDALCSYYIMRKTTEHSAERQQFNIPNKFFYEWKNTIDAFFEYKTFVMKHRPDYMQCYYENIKNNFTEDFWTTKISNFNYSVDCLNYNDMEKKVKYYETLMGQKYINDQIF